MDIWTAKKRSLVMGKIKGSNTKPEKMLRSALHRAGLRFRVNVKNLPGKPDIVLKRHATVIFVHGCFWHHHDGCKNANFPKSNSEFWRAKIMKTVERDAIKNTSLQKAGWKVIVVWECDIEKDVNIVVEGIIQTIFESGSLCKITPQPPFPA